MSDAARSYDLVIVGASFAGLVAARTAALRGLSVAGMTLRSDELSRLILGSLRTSSRRARRR